MKNTYLNIFIFLTLLGNVTAQQKPAPAQTKGFSIEGATAHLGNGQVIENSLIMFSEGKIVFAGSNNVKIRRIGTIIKATKKHVYPGFIILNTTLGLGEIDAVRATIDQDEVGQMLPHVRSIIAYNAESKLVEAIRPNGILLGQIVPQGGVISGTSSVVQFDAWNWEDAILKVDEGIHINWPSTFNRSKVNKNYNSEVQKISNYFTNAKAYLKDSKLSKNLAFESMQGLYTGDKKLYIHAESANEIMDAIIFFKSNGIEEIALVEGFEADKVGDFLVKNNIPVILGIPHNLQISNDEAYNTQYKMAKVLVDKNVVVSISGMGSKMSRMNARNLPFYAGTFSAFGLDKEEAVKLITLNAAKILGIEESCGSLEVGKDATLFISEGDALDMRTNNLSHAFIDGRKISLETHQTELWKRYSNKYQTK